VRIEIKNLGHGIHGTTRKEFMAGKPNMKPHPDYTRILPEGKTEGTIQAIGIRHTGPPPSFSFRDGIFRVVPWIP